MTTSLVLGVNGQDGSYLAEELLERGHDVVGVGRLPASRYVRHPRFRYVQLDISDAEALGGLLRASNVDQAFHFAVLHGASDFTYESVWRDMAAVNVLSLHVLLEHARTTAPDLRIVYAGSRKIFPAPLMGSIDENTPVQATCLYSIGKVAARDLIQHYSAQHGVKGTNLILFHHESPRRQPEYLFPTVVRGIVAAREDPKQRIKVRSLDFWIDWGDAQEFMGIVADLAEKSDETEVMVASGRSWYARDAVHHLLANYGLDPSFVQEASPTLAQTGLSFQAKLDRLGQALGRIPQRQIDDTADSIVRSVTREQALQRVGT